MEKMFDYCSSLSNLDIRNLSFDSVTKDSFMFNQVPDSATIYVKNQSTKDYILDNINSYLTNIQIVGS